MKGPELLTKMTVLSLRQELTGKSYNNIPMANEQMKMFLSQRGEIRYPFFTYQIHKFLIEILFRDRLLWDGHSQCLWVETQIAKSSHRTSRKSEQFTNTQDFALVILHLGVSPQGKKLGGWNLYEKCKCINSYNNSWEMTYIFKSSQCWNTYSSSIC